jgi:hypothetical protein
VSIWAFDDFVGLHIWLEGLKYCLETSMIKLAAKALEFRALSLTFAG